MISKNNTLYNSLQLPSYLFPHWRNLSGIFTGCNKNTTFRQSFHWKLLGQAHALTLHQNTYMKLLSRMNTLVPLNLQCCYCFTSINLHLQHLPITQVTSEKKINCIFSAKHSRNTYIPRIWTPMGLFWTSEISRKRDTTFMYNKMTAVKRKLVSL